MDTNNEGTDEDSRPGYNLATDNLQNPRLVGYPNDGTVSLVDIYSNHS